MSPQNSETAGERSGIFDRATLVLAWLGIACMLFMVVIIVASVVLRYVFAQPILGSNEIIQLTAVALVMCGLPYATAHDVHVNVDVFDNALGPKGRLVGEVISAILAIVVLGLLVWRAALKALDAWQWGDATNMLSLPIWPFYGILGAGMVLTVLVYLIRLYDLLTGKLKP